MKTKTLNRILIGVFLLLCLIPAAGMLAFGPSAAAANEVQSAKPRLMNRDGGLNADFFSDAAAYFGDHYYLRLQSITGWSKLNATLFGTSVDDSVLLGNSGELYYTETLEDYAGTGLSDGRLAAAVNNLSLIQEYAAGTGAEFVFTIAPNKNTVYPENMPGWLDAGPETSNLTRLKPLLEEAGIPYANIRDAIGAEGERLYYATDSHWNSKGAALGADTLLQTVGRESNYFLQSFVPGERHRGDLYEMLYPTGTLTEQDWTLSEPFTFTTKTGTNGGKALTIEAECASGEGILVCWRDSFGNALYPFLAENFSEALFLREATYNLTRLEERCPDVVMIELVERNIDWLITYAPILPAPQREISPEQTGNPVKLEITEGGKNAEGLLQLQCTLPAAAADEGRPAYIICGTQAYEAIVLYPQGVNSVVLSAWIPQTDCRDIRAVIFSAGVLTEHPAV